MNGASSVPAAVLYCTCVTGDNVAMLGPVSTQADTRGVERGGCQQQVRTVRSLHSGHLSP